MRALTLAHRLLGVPFCLLFAMWFASGIVMHFVPFPTLSEADRIEGLAAVAQGILNRKPEVQESQARNDAAHRAIGSINRQRGELHEDWILVPE